MSREKHPWEVMQQSAAGAKDVFLAAPYIKRDALTWLLSLIDGSDGLTCVSRWRRSDVVTGVSDRECRQIIIERRGNFRLHQSMHAKYYRFDEFVLVGSANLTGAGLGYSKWPNLEVLCTPGDWFNWRSFESRLLSESYILKDDEYELWLQIEVTGRAMEPSAGGTVAAESEPVNWEPRTREPEHLWLAYCGMDQNIPGDDELRAASNDLSELDMPIGLGRDDFDNWVVGALLESAWVGRVRSLWGRDRMEVREILEQEWEMEPALVERARETLESWILRYLS
jgi:hypothetical protein